MAHVLEVFGQAVVLFVSTDLDDVLILLIFFADPRYSVRRIALGQYIGIAALYAISVIGSWAALIMPASWVGVLGVVPLVMGLRAAWQLRGTGEGQAQTLSGGTGTLAVALMTLANGADNISVYVPLFALRSKVDIALIGVVFAIMTTAWLCLAHWLTRHASIGAPVRRYTRVLMPFVFIGLGLFILYQAGTLGLLAGMLDSRR